MALTDNLMAYYKFDSNVNDSLGLFNCAENGISYSNDGVISKSATLTSGSGDYIKAPTGLYNSANSRTIWGWFKSTNFSVQNHIISGRYTSGGDIDRQLSITQSTGVLNYYRYDSSSAHITNITTISNGVWYFFVITEDASAGGKVYLTTKTTGTFNTTPVGTNGTVRNFNIGANANFGIGCRYDNNTLNSSSNIEVDEIGISSRVLTTDEMTELYNGGVGLTYPFTTTPAFTPYNIIF